MTITLTALQKQRRDTASNWTSNNTVLLAGEWGIESDTKKFKIGDGSTAWQSLDYVPIPDANRSLTGNINATGNLSAGGTLSSTGNTTIGGALAVSGAIDGNGGATIDNIQIGITNNNEIDTSSGDLTIDSAGGNTIIDDTLTVSGNATLQGTLGVTGNTTLSGNATVTGDFTVNGTTTTIDTTTLSVEDKNIELGKVSTPSDTSASGGGITLKGATDKTINWLDSTDSWTSSEHFSVSGQKEFRYLDSDSSNYVGFKAPATVTSNLVWTLPASDASVNGYVLASDANGNLSWVDPGSSTNPAFTGNLSLQNDGNIRGFASLQATYTGSTKTLTITVAAKTAAHRYNGTGSSNGYKVDGYEAPFITLTPGRTYRLDQSDSSNSGHPIAFYLEANKTTEYTTGITFYADGSKANSSAYNSSFNSASSRYVEIEVTDTTPLILHYMCINHAHMGNSINNNSNKVNFNDLLNKPTVPTNNNQLTNGAGFIDGSALNASNLSSGTIPDARFPLVLPAISGANLTNLPAITGGLVGGGNEELFVEASNTMNNDFSTSANKNYISLTPITINGSLTITNTSIMNFI